MCCEKERLPLFLHFSARSCRSDVLLDHFSGCGKLSGCSCRSPFVLPFTGGITQQFTERITAVQANQPAPLATSALKDAILPPQCFWTSPVCVFVQLTCFFRGPRLQRSTKIELIRFRISLSAAWVHYSWVAGDGLLGRCFRSDWGRSEESKKLLKKMKPYSLKGGWSIACIFFFSFLFFYSMSCSDRQRPNWRKGSRHKHSAETQKDGDIKWIRWLQREIGDRKGANQE